MALTFLCAVLSFQNSWGQANASPSSPTTKAAVVKIRMKLNDAVIATATLDDNETARQFAAALPLNLHFKDYASTEKIADLPSALTTQGSPDGYTPVAGDISYYAPWGNLAIFHQNFKFSNGLIRLGRLTTGLEAMRRTGPMSVLVERQAP